MKKLHYKALQINMKAVSDAGHFTGYAAVFNNVDLGGDIIAPGAFAKTIQEKSDHPILWGHSTREVIGVNRKYTEDDNGLLVEGQLVMDVQRAREAHALMKAGAVKGMSIGYDTKRDELDHETGIRILKEVKLWEYSLTPFPMNPQAQVTDVKSMDELSCDLNDVIEALGQVQPLSPEALLLIESAQKRLSALHAAQAPAAAMHDIITPDKIHLVMTGRKILA